MDVKIFVASQSGFTNKRLKLVQRRLCAITNPSSSLTKINKYKNAKEMREPPTSAN